MNGPKRSTTCRVDATSGVKSATLVLLSPDGSPNEPGGTPNRSKPRDEMALRPSHVPFGTVLATVSLAEAKLYSRTSGTLTVHGCSALKMSTPYSSSPKQRSAD